VLKRLISRNILISAFRPVYTTLFDVFILPTGVFSVFVRFSQLEKGPLSKYENALEPSQGCRPRTKQHSVWCGCDL